MDTVRIGSFLKELRKEKGFTQEQLGERLGVTNKTVSRWETGSYIPPVECLELLSDLYGVSINEIVAGQRLSPEELPAAAEENLSGALELSEEGYKRSEKWLMIFMACSNVIAIVIILLLPGEHFLRTFIIILLVVVLAGLNNTVNLVALFLNKEHYQKK